MRVFILVLCLCGISDAQSIVTSSDRQSIVMSSYAQETQGPVITQKITVPVIAFPKPDKVTQATKPSSAVSSKMSHNEMVALHNSLHGPGEWTWPGDLETHLRETHGVSTASTALSSVKFMSSSVSRPVSNCPNGVCPTRRRVTIRSRRQR